MGKFLAKRKVQQKQKGLMLFSLLTTKKIFGNISVGLKAFCREAERKQFPPRLRRFFQKLSGDQYFGAF